MEATHTKRSGSVGNSSAKKSGQKQQHSSSSSNDCGGSGAGGDKGGDKGASSSSSSGGGHHHHHHSIPSHRLGNYLKFLHELAAKGSTTAHLFSTAVISGSKSAPELKEMRPPQDGTSEEVWLLLWPALLLVQWLLLLQLLMLFPS